GVADEIDAIRDHADDQAAEEGAADPAAAAEEADPADHGRRDRVEQDCAATGAFETDAVEAGGEDDASHCGHRTGDHEDEDPDQLDVDPRAPGSLGVAANRVDVAAESRPAGDVSREHDEEDDDQSDERHTRSRLRLVADVDGSEGQPREECDPDDGENDVPGWEACPPAAEVGA